MIVNVTTDPRSFPLVSYACCCRKSALPLPRISIFPVQPSGRFSPTRRGALKFEIQCRQTPGIARVQFIDTSNLSWREPRDQREIVYRHKTSLLRVIGVIAHPPVMREVRFAERLVEESEGESAVSYPIMDNEDCRAIGADVKDPFIRTLLR